MLNNTDFVYIVGGVFKRRTDTKSRCAGNRGDRDSAAVFVGGFVLNKQIPETRLTVARFRSGQASRQSAEAFDSVGRYLI